MYSVFQLSFKFECFVKLVLSSLWLSSLAQHITYVHQHNVQPPAHFTPLDMKLMRLPSFVNSFFAICLCITGQRTNMIWSFCRSVTIITINRSRAFVRLPHLCCSYLLSRLFSLPGLSPLLLPNFGTHCRTRSANTSATFRSRLKTELFSAAYY